MSYYSRLKAEEIRKKSVKLHTSDQAILEKLREVASTKKLRNNLDPQDRFVPEWSPPTDSELIRGLIRRAGMELEKKREKKEAKK